MPELTDRQAQVLDLLNKDKTPREIASEIGVTRNAVYQFITAIKRKGALPEQYTPSGEIRLPASRAHEIVERVTDGVPTQPGGDAFAIIASLTEQNAKLVEIVDRLTSSD